MTAQAPAGDEGRPAGWPSAPALAWTVRPSPRPTPEPTPTPAASAAGSGALPAQPKRTAIEIADGDDPDSGPIPELSKFYDIVPRASAPSTGRGGDLFAGPTRSGGGRTSGGSAFDAFDLRTSRRHEPRRDEATPAPAPAPSPPVADAEEPSPSEPWPWRKRRTEA